ncbi:ABC transporter ATP-binding protein [Desulfothermobacter acidiphilus]|uniref:ABC transporter ATP-binding protein n=1 Tax=Desulfothermobacter acidiphilus TaxID=1938353 RepID=UPI003F88657D
MLLRARKLILRRRRRTILRDIDLEAGAGELVGIFGLKASGKTSLLHALAGVFPLAGGEVEVAGISLRRGRPYLRLVGLVTQEPSLFPELTVTENLDLLAALKGGDRDFALQLAERLELGPWLKTPAGRLEAGPYQRAALAGALAHRPRLLLADELLEGIDLDTRRLILDELRRFTDEGGTCLWGSSNLEFLPYLSRLFWLQGGQLGPCSPEELRQRWAELLPPSPPEGESSGA